MNPTVSCRLAFACVAAIVLLVLPGCGGGRYTFTVAIDDSLIDNGTGRPNANYEVHFFGANSSIADDFRNPGKVERTLREYRQEAPRLFVPDKTEVVTFNTSSEWTSQTVAKDNPIWDTWKGDAWVVALLKVPSGVFDPEIASNYVKVFPLSGEERKAFESAIGLRVFENALDITSGEKD